MQFTKYLIFLALLSSTAIVFGEARIGAVHDLPVRPMTLPDFIKLTKEKNVGIENQRLVVDNAIANQAPMSAPNLNPQFTYSRGSYYGQTPYTPYVSPSSNTYALQATLEGWGKRSARSKVADAEVAKSQADLNSASSNIELDASFSYFDALRPKLLAVTFRDALAQLKGLKVSNNDSLVQQYINREEQEARNYKYFMIGMLNLTPKSDHFLVEPTGRGVCNVNKKSLNDLIQHALENRTDLISSELAIKTADNYVELAKANRNIDIMPSVWTSRTPSYSDAGTSYGATSAYGFSVQIPIPTHLITDTSVKQAINNRGQFENNRDLLKAQTQVELRQAIMQYETALNAYEYAFENNKNADKAYPPNSKQNIQLRTDYMVSLIDSRINHSKALIYLMNKSGHYDVSTYCETK